MFVQHIRLKIVVKFEGTVPLEETPARTCDLEREESIFIRVSSLAFPGASTVSTKPSRKA